MKRVRIRLRGIVQGVGFRPFVHNLAAKWQLAGYVLNSSAGLVAEVEGEAAAVDRFVDAVRAGRAAARVDPGDGSRRARARGRHGIRDSP